MTIHNTNIKLYRVNTNEEIDTATLTLLCDKSRSPVAEPTKYNTYITSRLRGQFDLSLQHVIVAASVEWKTSSDVWREPHTCTAYKLSIRFTSARGILCTALVLSHKYDNPHWFIIARIWTLIIFVLVFPPESVLIAINE